MLIGGDDISNDVITLDACFHCFHLFLNVSLHSRSFRFALIGENLTSQLTGSHRGIGGGIQIPGTKLQALLPFPAPPPEHPGELAHRLHLYHRAIFSSRDHIYKVQFSKPPKNIHTFFSADQLSFISNA